MIINEAILISSEYWVVGFCQIKNWPVFAIEIYKTEECSVYISRMGLRWRSHFNTQRRGVNRRKFYPSIL
jgi:hypothetical protein